VADPNGPHAARCSHAVLNGIGIADGMERELHRLGLLLRGSGKAGRGEKMYQRALQGYEKALGPGHTSTLRTVYNLAFSTRTMASWTRPRRCTSGHCKDTRRHGPDHTSTLDTVNNLGNLIRFRASWMRPRRCTSGHCEERRRHGAQITHQH